MSSGPRVVLKIGTTSLITDGTLDPEKVARLCEAVCLGISAGLTPVVVTSGAIAIGRSRHPALAAGTDAAQEQAIQQVAAAVGQGLLYAALRESFAARGVETGQVLLTPYDLIEPARGGRVLATFDQLAELGMVAVVNENDALGVRNNDVLAALVSGLVGARLLLLLTNVPGLYDGNPRLADARRIDRVPVLTPAFEAMAGDSIGDGGTGGMLLKLSACWIATYAGVRTVIADTADPTVLVAADAGAAVGTEFSSRSFPGGAPDTGRLWRAFRTPPVGTLSCGAGASLAVEHRRPLRRVDVITARGAFRAGDVVNITGPDARLLARGSVRYPVSTVESGCTPSTELLISSDYVQIRED